jgi:CRP-like cAMP-binding protein
MRSNWIDQLSPVPRAAMCDAMVTRRFDRGALIYSRTEAPKGLYLVRSGSVLFGLDGVNGKRLLLRIVRENGLLGEAVAYDGRTAAASAEARTALVTEMIPAHALRGLRRDHPEIETALGTQAAAALRAVLGVLEEQALLPLYERGLYRLRRLCRDEGLACEDPGMLRLELSQSEFAAMLGVSRQATNELLSLLEERGIVRRRFKAIECRPDLLPR